MPLSLSRDRENAAFSPVLVAFSSNIRAWEGMPRLTSSWEIICASETGSYLVMPPDTIMCLK